MRYLPFAGCCTSHLADRPTDLQVARARFQSTRVWKAGHGAVPTASMHSHHHRASRSSGWCPTQQQEITTRIWGTLFYRENPKIVDHRYHRCDFSFILLYPVISSIITKEQMANVLPARLFVFSTLLAFLFCSLPLVHQPIIGVACSMDQSRQGEGTDRKGFSLDHPVSSFAL